MSLVMRMELGRAGSVLRYQRLEDCTRIVCLRLVKVSQFDDKDCTGRR